MNVDPAVGKILGMVMAYAVSALGLLLAYYNYRKRIVKADHIFTPRAQAVLWIVGTLTVVGLVLAAAAVSAGNRPEGQSILYDLPGIVAPGLVFALSFWVTWKLFKKFSSH
jgi:hypothetical protein